MDKTKCKTYSAQGNPVPDSTPNNADPTKADPNKPTPKEQQLTIQRRRLGEVLWKVDCCMEGGQHKLDVVRHHAPAHLEGVVIVSEGLEHPGQAGLALWRDVPLTLTRL